MDDGSNNVSASSFSHSILDTAPEHKEGVDPIQEAEVYMAYGRDGQAEEILLDALQKTPGNLAVHGKLLEIYAGRKSLPQFSTVVSDLHARTGGAGAEWEKAAELGRAIDPSNPLYTSATDTAGLPHQQTQVMPLDVDEAAQMDATMVLAAPIVLESSVTAPHIPPVAAETDSSGGLDFDLDLGAVATTPTAAEPAEMPANSAESSLDMDFDMDLGADRGPTGQGKSEDGNSIDFDIAAQTTTIETSVPTAKEDSPLDFNFDMDVPTVATEPAPPLDLSSINLELDAPQAEGSTGEASEVATKLELALAYDEMGDREGARELLQEVLAEGSPAQQELGTRQTGPVDIEGAAFAALSMLFCYQGFSHDDSSRYFASGLGRGSPIRATTESFVDSNICFPCNVGGFGNHAISLQIDAEAFSLDLAIDGAAVFHDDAWRPDFGSMEYGRSYY
jgi:pilus assembly protein FimV